MLRAPQSYQPAADSSYYPSNMAPGFGDPLDSAAREAAILARGDSGSALQPPGRGRCRAACAVLR